MVAEYLTIREVCDLLKIGERTVYHLCRTGKLGGAAKVGNQWRVDEVTPCVVLDPSSGSGTTGKVARDHGRSYVGIDLHVDYLALAKRRIGISGDGE